MGVRRTVTVICATETRIRPIGARARTGTTGTTANRPTGAICVDRAVDRCLTSQVVVASFAKTTIAIDDTGTAAEARALTGCGHLLTGESSAAIAVDVAGSSYAGDSVGALLDAVVRIVVGAICIDGARVTGELTSRAQVRSDAGVRYGTTVA
jgi:hypothetical protein